MGRSQAGCNTPACPRVQRLPWPRSVPLLPSLSQSRWQGSGLGWCCPGLGRGEDSGLLQPQGWVAMTHCPSRRIQGAGVSPCLEPEVPCAHSPPDVTNATMGTGSE